MPAPSIVRGSDHMFTSIYEGNGGGQRVGNFIPFTDNGTISKSIISNPSDNPALTYDISGETATSADIWTFSAWVKRSGTGSTQYFAGTSIDGNNESKLGFDSSNRAYWTNTAGGSVTALMISNRTFEDTSKWYHIVWSMDSTQSTAANRARLYVDGDEITSWNTATYITQNNDYIWTTGDEQRINWSTGEDLDGYMAEINNVDGQQLGPDTFGVTDTSTGRWVPKSLGSITYGNTGYRLQFANGAGQTIGDETSGNGHDFTVSNFTVSDVTTDSPTQNFPILSTNKSAMTLTEGGTVGLSPATGEKFAFSQMTFDPFDSTGYYMEFKLLEHSYAIVGFRLDDGTVSGTQAYQNAGYVAVNSGNDWYVDGVRSFDGSDIFANDGIVGVYVKNGDVFYSYGGTMQNSSNKVASFSKPGRYRIAIGHNANYSPLSKVQIICPQSKWNHSPSGDFANYREINQDNLPTPDKGVTSFAWIKNRDQADDHAFYDSSRGPHKVWKNSESSEDLKTNGVQKFLKGGFAVEEHVAVNSSAESYVAWNWVGNAGTEVANTAGSGANVATTVQVNDTAGFSICRFTGTGSTLRFAHGQSAAPEWIFAKRLGGSSFATQVYHHKTNTTTGDNYYTQLNEPDAKVNVTTNWRSVTSGYVEIGNNSNTNADSVDVIAYCWRGIEGYSKFGLYKGNGNANGPYINTSFKPSWIMIKRVDSATGGNWSIIDNVRGPFNPYNTSLLADANSAESSLSDVTTDLLSNGFKIRNTLNSCNNSSGTYIYMAFAEHPFIGDGTNPCTAR